MMMVSGNAFPHYYIFVKYWHWDIIKALLIQLFV